MFVVLFVSYYCKTPIWDEWFETVIEFESLVEFKVATPRVIPATVAPKAANPVDKEPILELKARSASAEAAFVNLI